MDKQDIAEQAYKNGYKQALKDFAERLKGYLTHPFDNSLHSVIDGICEVLTEGCNGKND